MDKNFYLGLDVGSDSVGWAVSDEDYNLVRLKGKRAWGARLFEEASDAKGRRMFRTAGRRLARRKRRIEFLQDVFNGEMSKVDPNFFKKLQESTLHMEDKDVKESILPAEVRKEFNKRFPTIWHLRKALLDCEDPNHDYALSDLRFVYLAIHHIIKYRGNFLIRGDVKIGEFSNSVFNEINDLAKSFVEEDTGTEDLPSLVNEELESKLISILENKDTYKTAKKKEILGLMQFANEEYKKKWGECFASLVVGGKFDLAKLSDEECDACSLSFAEKYDESEPAARSFLGDRYRFIECAKIIYDYVSLKELLNGKEYLSYSFADIFDSHKKEKASLKRLCHVIDEKNCFAGENSIYFKVFKDKSNDKNYPAFVHVNTDKKRPSLHDFNAYISQTVFNDSHKEIIESDKEWPQLKQLCGFDRLLQTVAIKSTSVIPHQLHQKELELILRNCAEKYHFLADNHDIIKSIFLYRIPYYYGPISPDSPYSNVKFKDEKRVKITPWNYRELIDEEATRAAFMQKLTNSCEYLKAEKNVLPRQSIIFMDFVTMNRLNGMSINGARIEQTIKEDLLINLLWKKAKVTKKGIQKYLELHYPDYKKDGVSISGINDDHFDNSVRACLAEKGVFDYDGKDFEKVEDIVNLLAAYCDDKEDAMAVIKKKYPSLTATQEKAIRSLSIKGWAPFSRRLLKGLYCNEDLNGEITNIYDVMRNEVKTFMEVLHDPRYGFLERIDEENRKAFDPNRGKDAIQEEIIESLPPKMRRAAIQTIRIVDEVSKAAKRAPEVIALEVTREAPKSKNKGSVPLSRKKELQQFLKNFAKKDKDGATNASARKESLLKELETIELEKLKGKHIYLYFKQNGFDLYTGKTMQLSDVIAGQYDIDHIIPQSKIKDDSLDNCVLVSKEYNQRIKKDIYPLPEEIRGNEEVRSLWKRLHKLGAISDKKYNNLMRSSELTDSELNEFVNAQLNVVNHANKGIVELIKNKYPDTKVIFSKAAFPSYIRQQYEIHKLRELNDTHHAVDAYLNIVAGTILHSTYGNLRVAKALEQKGQVVTSYNMFRAIDRALAENNLAKKVKENCLRHDFLMTYRPSYVDGAFYDQTLYKVPSKSGLDALVAAHDFLGKRRKGEPMPVDKYGGFNKMATECIFRCHIKTAKEVFDYLLPVKHLIVARCAGDVQLLKSNLVPVIESLFKNVTSVEFGRVIYNDQIVAVKGCRYLLANSDDNRVALKPFDPIYLENSDVGYLKMALSAEERLKRVESAQETYRCQFDSKGEHIVEFSKKRNLEIALRVKEISLMHKYDYFANGNKVREALGDEGISEFKTKSIWSQIELILECLKAYGRSRSQSKLLSSDFRRSRRISPEEDLKIIDQSVTGLF